VGIGTTNPAYNLDVTTTSTGIRILDQVAAVSAQDMLTLEMQGNAGVSRGVGILFKVPNNSGTSRDAARINGLGSASSAINGGTLRFETANSSNVMTERMRIDESGNVGIGTTAPVYKLDVVGDLNFTGTLRAGGLPGTTGQVLVSQGTSTPLWQDITSTIGSAAWLQGGNSFGALGVLGTNDNFGLQFKTNNQARMTITADGKVGIGTTAPSALLDVNGTAYLEKMTLREDATYTSPTANSQIYQSGGHLYVQAESSFGRNIYFNSGTGTPSTRMTILESGKVGIGSSKSVTRHRN